MVSYPCLNIYSICIEILKFECCLVKGSESSFVYLTVSQNPQRVLNANAYAMVASHCYDLYRYRLIQVFEIHIVFCPLPFDFFLLPISISSFISKIFKNTAI